MNVKTVKGSDLFAITCVSATILALGVLTFKSGVNEDVNMVLTPAKTLLDTGSLSKMPVNLGFQVIRESNGEPYEHNQGFFANYLGPVLYYTPLILVFGSGTSLPFAVGQAFACLAFALAVLWFYREKNPFLENAIILATLLLVLRDSIISNPTQALFYPFAVILWCKRDQFHLRPALLGLLIGAAMQFRPEALALYAALITREVLFRPGRILKDKLPVLAWSVFGVSCAVITFNILRNQLGASSSSDHTIYVLGHDVLAPRFGVLFGNKVHTTSEFLEFENIVAMCKKVGQRVAEVILLMESSILSPIRVFLLTTLACWLMFSRPSPPKSVHQDFAAFIVFTTCSALLGFIGVDASRYYDVVTVVGVLFFLDNLSILKASINSETCRKFATLALCLFLAAHIVFISRNTFSNSPAFVRENQYRATAERLRSHLSPSTRIMLRKSNLWTWYAGGERCVAYDGSPTISDKLFEAYQPEAIVVSSHKANPAPESIRSLRRIHDPELARQGYFLYAKE